MVHISLASEAVFHVGSFPITNTLLMSWFAMVVIIVVGVLATRKMDLIPRGLQNFFEAIIEGVLNLIQSVTGDHKRALKILPIIATFLLFITVSNWLGLLPGVGTIGFFESKTHEEATESTTSEGAVSEEDVTAQPFLTDPEAYKEPVATEPQEKEFVPLLRSTYSDINMTLALALISVFVTQFFGIAAIGALKYGKKFINFSGVVPFFVGFLELIGEIAHIISFSFRLFGNVFAGEVLLVVISTLVAYVAPLPFYFLEIFVGFIQALVFSLLTLVFITTAMTDHEAHESHASSHS